MMWESGRQCTCLVKHRWQQTLAKRPTASCGEAYEHVAFTYQCQYHFLLPGLKLRITYLTWYLRKHSSSPSHSASTAESCEEFLLGVECYIMISRCAICSLCQHSGGVHDYLASPNPFLRDCAIISLQTIRPGV